MSLAPFLEDRILDEIVVLINTHGVGITVVRAGSRPDQLWVDCEGVGPTITLEIKRP